MHLFFSKVGAWLVRKLLGAALVVILGIGGYVFWRVFHEAGDIAARHTDAVEALRREHSRNLEAKTALEQRVNELNSAIEVQRLRVERADKVIVTLHSLENAWDRWWNNREQQKANAEQIRRMEEVRDDSAGKLAELRRLLANTESEEGSIYRAVVRAERQLRFAERSKSEWSRRVYEAWMTTRVYVGITLLVLFLGPSLWAFFIYFGVAYMVARGRPVRLAAFPASLPVLSESRASLETALWPGEVLRVKQRYVQATEENVTRSARLLLDWGAPLVSVLNGLTGIAELCNGHVGGERRVTLSDSRDGRIQLAAIDIQEGSSFVLHPRFLVGIITGGGPTAGIRSHWTLFRLQSWLTGRPRFIEIVGPCRLLVAGRRGVRAEHLTMEEGRGQGMRHVKRQATIGFTPWLDYTLVRADTFWRYCFGRAPLFADQFAGTGVCVLQGGSAVASHANRRISEV